MAFKLYQCMLTKNDCYKKATPMTPKGIVVHSTGANNPYLKRYVQPDDGILGKNLYGNSWNRSGLNVCVHGFIGYDKNKNVKCYQTLPFNIACWGVGRGRKGSFNYNPTGHIQFEMCEDDLKNETYFNQVMDVASDFCAYLCKLYNLKVDSIVGHHEAYLLGYGSNHSDPENWMKKFGKDMNWFRKLVRQKIEGHQPDPEPTPTTGYLVRITADELNVRAGAGTNYKINTTVKKGEVFTIVEESKGWGRLKSGAGWISLNYTERVGQKYYVTAKDGLWLHNAKNFKSSSNVCVMKYKETVEVLDIDGSYAHVIYKGTKGYCSKNYLKKV